MQKIIINFCLLFLLALTSFAQSTTNPANGNATGDTTKNANAANLDIVESSAASGDNTMLYVGIGIVALLAIGFLVMRGRKKE